MTKTPDQRKIHANPAKTAADLHLTEAYMSNIRTANKRHKRAIVATIARNRAAVAPEVEVVEPAKAAV
jgi:hypothetical protein